MLTPKQLYETYSTTPCAWGNTFPVGRGSPFNWKRVIRFLKHLANPCYEAIDTNAIDGTGARQLALPFKILEKFDIDAFAEGQPQIDGGTAYAVRNSVDLTRACYFHAAGLQSSWSARMATEYLEHFCGNSLPDCLMMLGPDLLPESDAYNKAPSSLGCGIYYGASGESFFCYSAPGSEAPPTCICCPPPEECPEGSTEPNCLPEPDKENLCCGVGKTSRLDFSYSIPIDDAGTYTPSINNLYFPTISSIADVTSLADNIAGKIKNNDALRIGSQTWVLVNGSDVKNPKSYIQRDFIMKHIGVLERLNYGGYANFVTRSGSNFHAIMDDVFLDYFRNTFEPYKCRTISAVMNITSSRGSVSTNTSTMVDSIKDLLYNGYGIVLLSNVGFPNFRDSTGISYPDRIWYQTYSIIGYDDRLIEYPECVYVVSCPFGDWISGGHPSWGPLPPGCFLVTESHLKCMISFHPGLDFYGCRKQRCNPARYNCDLPENLKKFAGCGPPEEGKCHPYYCTDQQGAFGIVFALSFEDGFPAQTIPHEDFYPVTTIREQTQEQSIYFIP
mgnify:CR=1 FL=1